MVLETTRMAWEQRRGTGVLLGALTFLAGCATNEDILAVRRDMLALRNEVASLSKANQSSRDFTEERLRKVEADVRGRVESSAKESEGSRVALNQRLEELTTETRFAQGKMEESASVSAGPSKPAGRGGPAGSPNRSTDRRRWTSR